VQVSIYTPSKNDDVRTSGIKPSKRFLALDWEILFAGMGRHGLLIASSFSAPGVLWLAMSKTRQVWNVNKRSLEIFERTEEVFCDARFDDKVNVSERAALRPKMQLGMTKVGISDLRKSQKVYA